MNLYIWSLEYDLIPIIAENKQQAKSILTDTLLNKTPDSQMIKMIKSEYKHLVDFINKEPDEIKQGEVILYGHANE